ncbi:hypothetical protein [Pseudomonas sp. EpS/L25]|uniref:hypothetical protein n=1 Tax=Pseudomonas sp. EpS/L25 TaxID=1749078 RepID=UPI0007440B3B|nr:hypothetical protein [Pseudomonas sp. EpS/L25]KUM43367.1 hypothetical protein AR540_24255 [Pseudomonas sp. EpS/L25]
MNTDSTSATHAISEYSGLVAVLADLQLQGWHSTSLWDGEQWFSIPTTWSDDEIVERAAYTELGNLRFSQQSDSFSEGVVQLVRGNCPIELIADMTMANGFDEAVERAQRTVWSDYPKM